MPTPWGTKNYMSRGGGVIDCSTWSSTPLTLHQLATQLYLICSLSADCGKLHTYDVALLRPLGAITTCHSLHLKRTFAVYTHIHKHTHTQQFQQRKFLCCQSSCVVRLAVTSLAGQELQMLLYYYYYYYFTIHYTTHI